MARPTYIYHERQLGALCGVHCVNNLLQGPRFGPGDLAEIGVRLDKKEQRLLRKGIRGEGATGSGASPRLDGEGSPSPNFDGSADGGNFSIQVLSIALARAGLKLLPAEHPDGRELMVGDRAHAAGAFVVQRKNHWYTLRAIGPCWWDLDSTREQPKPLDEVGLSARLRRLATGGHSIFLVIGDVPAPLPPLVFADGVDATGAAVRGVATLEEGHTSWHDASALLIERDMGGIEAVESGSPESADALDADSLEGFSDSEVQAALFLADHNHRRAAEALRKARQSIHDLLAADPQRLAQALSAAVGAVLQARRSLHAAIARLVALLCAPGADRLAAAAMLVDCGNLAHRLLNSLAKKARGWLWTEGLMQAATIAVDLLLALPAASETAATAAPPVSPSDGASFEAPGSGSDGEPAPLELPGPACEVPHATPRSAGYRSSAAKKAQVVNSTVEFDFSTKALDDLLDTVALEAGIPGQPLISALGLKAIDSIISIPMNVGSRDAAMCGKDSPPSPTADARQRTRRRPNTHSAPLPA